MIFNEKIIALKFGNLNWVNIFASHFEKNKVKTMKKLFAILVIAGAVAACNNEKTEEVKKDSTPAVAVDTTKKVDTTKMAADNSKKAMDTAKKAK